MLNFEDKISLYSEFRDAIREYKKSAENYDGYMTVLINMMQKLREAQVDLMDASDAVDDVINRAIAADQKVIVE